QRPRISPSHFRETLKLTTGETPFGRSAGKSSNNLFGPNRRDPAPHHDAASLPVHFDFSSLRAGIAMLLMRFFAVNAQPGHPMHSPRRNVYLLGAGVTPAQGSVKPTAGFTYNESKFILVFAPGGADVPIRILLQPLRS